MTALEAGFGKVDITPACDGTFEVFEPIYMRALHLRQGEKRITFLAADLFAMDDGLVAMIQQEIGDAEAAGHWLLPGASHLGTGPALFQFYVAQPTEALRQFGQDRRYAKAAADAIRQAIADASPAQIDAAVADAPPDLSYNRRAHDSSGKLPVVSLTEFPEPPQDLIYDPTDRQFGIVGLRREGKRPIVLTNFGCHALTRWTQRGHIAGDYPGRLCQLLDEQGVDALFMQGALGNTHPWRSGSDPCQRLARALNELTHQLLDNLSYDGEQELHILETSVQVSTDERLPSVAQAQAKWEESLKEKEAQEGLDRYWYWLSRRYAQEHEYRMLIRAITFGDTALVHVPGEPFVETARAIRDAAPFRQVLILSNPCPEVGYLPTQRAHDEGDGEVPFAPMERETEANIRQAIINLLGQGAAIGSGA